MLTSRHFGPGLTAAFAALAALATGTPAQAQITQYTNRAAFTAAAPGLTTLDFASANTSGGLVTNYSTPAGLTLGGVNFTATSAGVPSFSIVAPDYYSTYRGWSGNPTVLSAVNSTFFLPANTTAIGTDLYTLHLGDGAANTVGPVDFVFFSGSSQIGSFTETTFANPTLAFAGFTSTKAITSIQITAENGNYTEFSKFAFGSPVPAVPEASTTVSLGLLLALGMGGMVVAARRRRNTP